MRNHQSSLRLDNNSATSDVLADLALNAFGLVLIILLLYLMIAMRADSRRPSVASSLTQPSSASSSEMLHQLERRRSELQQALLKEAAAEQDSGLWCFRIRVKRLVAFDRSSQSANLKVDYFLQLNIRQGQVTGTLFGARDDQHQSANHARISGTWETNRMRLVLHFTRDAEGVTEILHLTRDQDRWVGELEAGSGKPRYQNFEGTVIGERLSEKSFSN